MLKNLEAWNAERWSAHRRVHAMIEAHKTGFACPRCQAELWFRDPNLTFGGVHDLKADPMTRDVYCPQCMFVGVQLV